MTDMERLDVYDKNRNFLGYTHIRGQIVKEGEYHLTVQICVLDAAGRLLMTRRHPAKTWGGLWEVTAGCVLSGEDSRFAAVRELEEETGLHITEEDLNLMCTYRMSDHHIDCYLVQLDVRGEEVTVTLQEGETIDYVWADDEIIDRLMREGSGVSITAQAIGYLKRR